MPHISEGDYSEYMRLKQVADDIQPHVDAWIRLIERHVAQLPPDTPQTPESDGCSDRGYAEHELNAMRRDLRALHPATA
jgi:hypothetical protein